jgi:hypothetical protein
VLSAGASRTLFFYEVVTPPPPPFSTGLGTGYGGVAVLLSYLYTLPALKIMNENDLFFSEDDIICFQTKPVSWLLVVWTYLIRLSVQMIMLLFR